MAKGLINDSFWKKIKWCLGWPGSRMRESAALAAAGKLHIELLKSTSNGFVKFRVIEDNEKALDFEILEVNGAFEKMVKLNSGQLVGRRIRQVWPEMSEDWLELLGRVVKSGAAESTEGYMSASEGYYRVSVVRAVKGEVAALIADQTGIMKMQETLAKGWAKVLEVRDEETEGHSERVVSLTLELARRCGVKGGAIQYLKWGALLHDIGKMGLSDRILKKGGRLTRKEREEMKKHPALAERILGVVPTPEIKEIPFCHHEKWDGTGYPLKLKGEEIPLSARIFSVVDVWDALISKRRYHEAWSKKTALNYIINKAGKDFDPRVVEEFVKLINGKR